jgi:hypothetical protein
MAYEKVFVSDYGSGVYSGGTPKVILIHLYTSIVDDGIGDKTVTLINNQMFFTIPEAIEVFGDNYMDKTVKLYYDEWRDYEKGFFDGGDN